LLQLTAVPRLVAATAAAAVAAVVMAVAAVMAMAVDIRLRFNIRQSATRLTPIFEHGLQSMRLMEGRIILQALLPALPMAVTLRHSYHHNQAASTGQCRHHLTLFR
jgi:hypothetical protein